jgi:excisionase family DNA binding protein
MAVDVGVDYVSVPEAARLLAVSPSTVWRWIERGDLPAARIGRRRIKIRRTDIQQVVSPAKTTATFNGQRMTVDQLRAQKSQQEAIERDLTFLKDAAAFGDALAAKYPDLVSRPSWEIIRELRDRR